MKTNGAGENDKMTNEAESYDEVTARIAQYHGLALDIAERLLERFELTTSDREYLYRNPEHLAYYEGEGVDSDLGWVIWFACSYTAVSASVNGGDAAHHDNVSSLEEAQKAAAGQSVIISNMTNRDENGVAIDFDRGVEIVSGEGDGEGTSEEYDGEPTVSALRERLESERCDGDRWAFARPSGATMSEERYAL